MKKFAEVLKTLGEENRLRIFKLLQERPAYVCEIAAVLGLSMGTVSSHLSRLKYLGIVKDEKEGIKIKYSLLEPTEPEIKAFIRFLKEIGEDWEIIKKDRESLKKVKQEDVCKKLKTEQF
ncbi:ArsR/SmtB family transcription factor [Desulfurobacterium thermolithotrophum]|uniref:ArsR/SmtB family transcription factor n=1 Tax=Desulfurobacterium thermolithotrophum TaxID=64160 RepID=UPI0013D8BA13|nr:metalloregulator ArsR/SmtB family transcription factor [Desulfurobacterium thermolithotrophum]